MRTSKPWRHPKSNSWWFRVTVPERYRAVIGQTEIKFSLETTDEREAKRKHAEEYARLLGRYDLIDKARAEGDEARAIFAVDSWIADQIRAHGNAEKFTWLHLSTWAAFELMNSDPVGVMERQDEWIYIAPDEAALVEDASLETPRFGSPAALDAALIRRRITEQSELSRGLTGVEAAQRIIAAKAWRRVDYIVQFVASHGGLKVAIGTPIHAVMAERLVRRMIELAAVSARPEVIAALPPPVAEPGRALPPSGPHDLSENPSGPATGGPSSAAAVADVGQANAGERALSAVFEDWAEGFLKKKGVDRHKTVDEWRRNIRQFIGMHGDLDVNDITVGMVRSFRKTLHRAPSNAGKDLSALCLREQARIAAENDLPRISAATVNKALSAIRVTLEHAREEMEIIKSEENVAKNVTSLPLSGSEGLRLPFEDNDLRAIFRHPLVSDSTGISSQTLLWLLLLGPYTGCRLNELGQLRPSNIRSDQGIWYIAIERDRKNTPTSNGQKSLKTSAANRHIPVHSFLVEAGFLDLASQRSNYPWLFPDLNADPYGNRTTRASRVLNDYFDSVGITDSEKVYHSFRHTIRRRMRGVVDQEIADLIAGHEGEGSGARYGRGAALPVLKRAIETLRYDEVDWQPALRLLQTLEPPIVP